MADQRAKTDKNPPLPRRKFLCGERPAKAITGRPVILRRQHAACQPRAGAAGAQQRPGRPEAKERDHACTERQRTAP